VPPKRCWLPASSHAPSPADADASADADADADDGTLLLWGRGREG